MEIMDVEVVATAEHERARGEASREVLREDAESRLVLRDERAAELAFRFFSFFFNTPVSIVQAWIAVPTSSSYFLHFPKALVQFFSALANSFDCADKSHVLIVAALDAMVASSQQVQASDPVFLMHSPVLFLNVVMAVLQIVTSVMLG